MFLFTHLNTSRDIMYIFLTLILEGRLRPKKNGSGRATRVCGRFYWSLYCRTSYVIVVYEGVALCPSPRLSAARDEITKHFVFILPRKKKNIFPRKFDQLHNILLFAKIQVLRHFLRKYFFPPNHSIVVGRRCVCFALLISGIFCVFG